MSCVTPHLYNSVAMYQYHQQQQIQQNHPHLLTRPVLLCHRLPAVVGQYGGVPSRPGIGPYPRPVDVQPPPRNPVKPLTPFSIADILRDGQAGSPSPPASSVVPGRAVRAGVEASRHRRSPDSTLRPRRPGSLRADDGRRTPHGATISRPWDDSDRPRRHSVSDAEDDDDCDDVIDDDDEEIEVDDTDATRLTTTSSTTLKDRGVAASHQSTTSVCPLDALLRMTSQPFDDPSSPGLHAIFSILCFFLRD